MAVTYSKNLRLQIDSNLTAGAKYNLTRIDELGAIYQATLDSTNVRSVDSLSLRPNDASVGGSGFGGELNLAVSAQPATSVNVYTDLFNVQATVVTFADDTQFTGNWVLPWSYIDLSSASVTSFPDFSSAVAAQSNVAAATAHVNSTTGVHGVSGEVVGTTDSQVLINKQINATNNSITNLSNDSIAPAAGIAYSKLNLTGQLQNADFAVGLAFAWANIDFTGSSLSDIQTKPHSALTGVGKNNHAQIDTHLGSSIGVHGLSGAVLGTTDNQTLSNKNIDAAQNFVTNISNNEIQANAAISGTKIDADFGNQYVATNFGVAIGDAFVMTLNQSPGQSGPIQYAFPAAYGAAGTVLSQDGAGNMAWVTVAGTGTVTSIDATSTASAFMISGGPISTAGTFTFSAVPEPLGTVYAGPVSGANAEPTFRMLAATDIPSLLASKISDFTTAWDAQLATKSTDNLAEGTANLYYTTTRFDTRFGTKTSDNLTEGATNLYFTPTRFNSAFAVKTTDNLSEGSANLYFTSTRTDARITLQKGQPNGLATLDGAGKVPSAQLPTSLIQSYKATWTTGLAYVASHGLGTTDVLVQVYDLVTAQQIIVDSVVLTDANTVTLFSSQAPTGAGFRILILAV